MIPEDDNWENDLYVSQILQAKSNTTETVEKADRIEQIKQTSQSLLPDENPDIIIEEVFVDGESFELGVYPNSKDCRCCPVYHNEVEMSDYSKQDVANMLKELMEQFSAVKSQNVILVAQIGEFKDEFKTYKGHIESNIEELKEDNRALRAENKLLKERVQTVERRMKKYNLTIYNLRGDNVIDSVIALLRDNLEINFSERDFRDAYR
ncbi:unnamed protein product [Phaedon cochleariae]|uniref:Uncharacterized protein n=1 Tax=Phaedon cochleariae TaxID=80249 RepID=A0A9N9X5T6_PHACE|nr:unnamed protein product [Phaedon cochleariae]